MLTFFEYLRQRAFESVLAGAQEAIEFLEREEALAEPKKRVLHSPADRGNETPKPPRKRDEQLIPSQSNPVGKNQKDDSALKKGEAGRPTKDGKGHK